MFTTECNFSKITAFKLETLQKTNFINFIVVIFMWMNFLKNFRTAISQDTSPRLLLLVKKYLESLLLARSFGKLSNIHFHYPFPFPLLLSLFYTFLFPSDNFLLFWPLSEILNFQVKRWRQESTSSTF